ncbi:FKBP-type peptidyl-prolyl cis-trans isomerase [Algoriphagus terrigena]|uniref:FKBP-type peptidyl-prolyl cis-trans isomerase n=1 Tax=Algoriphagus terrigena TaxID=344884 RepID=UPI000405EE46|nr:FKBP-type peptidyl-prolyl cis-trans isomerase [Algoriphagus terrigena]
MKKIPLLFLILLGCSDKFISTKSGLQYQILEEGSGIRAQAGDEVFIYETTSYRGGTVLYSNYDTTSPVKVLIGGNQATAAVDEGLRGMQVGEVRKLVAPPYLVK